MKKETTAVTEASKTPVTKKKYSITNDKESSWNKEGDELCYISWKPNGVFSSVSNYPSVGFSLALDLKYGESSTYISDVITEIVENNTNKVKFKTKDGIFVLSVQTNNK